MGAAGTDPQPVTPEDEKAIADLDAAIVKNNRKGYNFIRLNLPKTPTVTEKGLKQ